MLYEAGRHASSPLDPPQGSPAGTAILQPFWSSARRRWPSESSNSPPSSIITTICRPILALPQGLAQVRADLCMPPRGPNRRDALRRTRSIAIAPQHPPLAFDCKSRALCTARIATAPAGMALVVLVAAGAILCSACGAAAWGTGEWVDARGTFYGQDAWPLHTGSCGYGFVCPHRWVLRRAPPPHAQDDVGHQHLVAQRISMRIKRSHIAAWRWVARRWSGELKEGYDLVAISDKSPLYDPPNSCG